MPELELTELNIVLSVVGAFLICFGVVSSKIKDKLYLGEALPATIVGILVGPVVGRVIDSTKWGSAEPDQQSEITLVGPISSDNDKMFELSSVIVIGIQLVIVGFQLPARYQLHRFKENAIAMLPVMTTMWLCTTACVYAVIPNLTFLAALVIGSCAACTDPVLSQAIVKGPFANKYIPRHLREVMSSEAGANDSFAFPALMLATFLIRHAAVTGEANVSEKVVARADDVGKIGGGVGVAVKMWFLETVLYTVLLAIVYGAIVGYSSCLALKFAIRRRWISTENLLLFPTALGHQLFILGTAGAFGTEELLACFAAGNALNWNGIYLEESESRHDDINTSISSLLNYGAFIYIGTVLPWNEFNSPEVTGITYPRLFALSLLVLFLRRIPVTLVAYKMLPKVCANAREALFMGYFGPIEHTRTLFPELGEGDEEEFNLIASLTPSVKPIEEDTIEILPFSQNSPLPRQSKSFESTEKVVVLDEKKEKHVSWESKTSFDDDKQSLDLSDVKKEVKDMV
ncbi:hypothetical protein SLS57_011004 [Botryosphaeria dothidea]